MSITIQVGWWIAPLAVTVGSLAWAFWPQRDYNNSYGGDIAILFTGTFAIAISLAAWLVWALLR